MNYEEAYKIVHATCCKECTDLILIVPVGELKEAKLARFRERFEPKYSTDEYKEAAAVLFDKVKSSHPEELASPLATVYFVVNDGLEYTIDWLTGEYEDDHFVVDRLRDKLPHVCIS